MSYTNSSLVSHTNLSPNNSGARTHTIDRITPHCVVGQCSVETLGNIFARSSYKASSNYGIGYDGRVGMYVEEKNRSWCSSSYSNDQRAVTIECASDTTEPYAFKDIVYQKLITLCVDICKRNGKTKLLWFGDKTKTLNYEPKSDEMVLTVHRWFANKSCPGNWMYARMSDLAEKVTAQLSSTASTPPPTTTSFSVNEIVKFAGGKHYVSANGTNGSSVGASKAKITVVSNGSAHPYHLRAVDDSGKFISGVYGWVDASTVSKIQTTATTIGGTVKVELNKLTKGMKNNQVRAMQILLIGRGYSCGSMGADGDFGQGTYDAIVKFQKAMGIDVDGICGIQTWTKLLKG